MASLSAGSPHALGYLRCSEVTVTVDGSAGPSGRASVRGNPWLHGFVPGSPM